MPIIQSQPDPGSEDATLYTPFKVTSLGGDWVTVGSGEAFYDPTIGGELLDIKGLGLPFRVNSKSFIYLMVIFDLSGRSTFAGICHTGKNLPWLIPGERWLNYPRMYAVDEMWYRGIWSKSEYDNLRPGVEGADFSEIRDIKKTERGGKRHKKTLPDGRVIDEMSDPLQQYGWFSNKRGGIEGGLSHGRGDNVGGTDSVGHARDNLFIGTNNKSLQQTPFAGGSYALADGFRQDEWMTVDVHNGGYSNNQIYTGIDRELRKCICAQGLNSTNPDWSHNPAGRAWPYNLNDVGWWPVQGINPVPLMWRRQMRGYIDDQGNTPPGTRGAYEIGGYMNPAANIYNGVSFGRGARGSSAKQELSYRSTYERVAKSFLYKTEKQWRTETDQVMCFYPIAYATQPTRNLDDDFTSGGIRVSSVIHKWVDQFDGSNQEFREREFEIKQACTTNLRLATVIEGGSRYKVLMPYQGMHTELISGNGDKSNTDLNFVQQWIYHSQNRGLGSQAPYYRSGASRQTATDGKYYYKRLSAVDLPYNQNYIDVLYNNQTPPIKK